MKFNLMGEAMKHRSHTVYEMESDIGSCIAFPLWYPATEQRPVWGVAKVKFTRKGEIMQALIFERQFMRERGGSLDGYRAFYAKFDTPVEQIDAIYKADLDALKRLEERAAYRGVDIDNEVPNL